MDPLTTGALVLGALWIASRKGSTVTRPTYPTTSTTGAVRSDRMPSRYAVSKLSSLQARWRGALGENVRALAPRVWPGVPRTVFMGFTSIGARDEDTAPRANRIFHEVGYFQTPAGPADGPAPNPNPNAPYNSWGKIANGTAAAELLGRPVVMTPGAWKGAAAVPDQVAVGLLDLRRELEGFERAARAIGSGVVVPRSSSSVYTVACAFSAFSAGATGAARNLSRIGSSGWSSSGGTEATAWDWIVEEIARRWRAGSIALENPGTHRNAAYTVLRTTQKLAAGAKLAESLGLADELAWYPRVARGALLDAERALTAAAYGVRA